MWVAVFGHYDSRGGTTAIKLPNFPTFKDVEAAINRYDVEVFDIDITKREEHETPGLYDFLYVAELYGKLVMPANNGGDLELTGSVLIDHDTVMGGDEEPSSIRVGATIVETLAAPVQLEFVPFPRNFDLDDDVDKARIVATSKYLANPSVTCWDDDAYGFILMD
jgi:hypothetical protein